MSLSAMSTHLLNTRRDGEATTSLGSPLQCSATLSMKKFLLTSSLNLPLWSLRLFLCPITCHPRKEQHHPHGKLLSVTALHSALPRTAIPWPTPAVGRLDYYLRATIHKEHCGMLLPRLDIMRFVHHSIELHVWLSAEVKDLRRDVIRGTTCRRKFTPSAVTDSRLCLPPSQKKLILFKLDPSQGSFNTQTITRLVSAFQRILSLGNKQPLCACIGQ